MPKAKLSQRVVKWAEKKSAQGHEVRTTKNGHPYAVIRAGRVRPAKTAGKTP